MELLVVVGIIGVLASLLLPALHSATLKGQGIVCLNNTRQLTFAWLMYAEDHEGWLCPNGSGPKQGWVEGVLDFNGSPDNTNVLYLTDPQYAKLADYIKTPAVYRCPSDKSTVHIGRGEYPRLRSLAMNDAVGANAEGSSLPVERHWKVYHKQSEITAPSPASLWVLTEQHPDSIDDGRFVVDCADQGSDARLIDFPASFHDRACSLSFADGHSEMHRWLVSDTMPPNRYCGCLAHYALRGVFVSSRNSVDVAWLQARTSASTAP